VRAASCRRPGLLLVWKRNGEERRGTTPGKA
jgi:hypothetical protein